MLGLLLAGLLGPAAPAAADPLDEICKEVPAPVRPDFQVAGLVMDKPDLAEVPDAAPDPFKDPTVPISDVYGWAWRYTNYDLGCGADFVRDPSAVASTSLANVAMAGLATMNSAGRLGGEHGPQRPPSTFSSRSSPRSPTPSTNEC